MEVENYMSSRITIGNNKKEEDDDDDVPLPGFRFHPTDEELVSFYLRRKVEKRPISIELIKQADIYKYDPWDLPKYSSTNGGEKEWYFFCRRGRKYKNSIRPNRVTSSGFWKATGIDRPIYSSSRECIGLKKSLVYYRGSAGKGTKTEWMMHEFRLPPKTTKHVDNSSTIDNPQEAEVWTLCRILKRNVTYRKCAPADWREVADDHHNKRSNNMIINNPVIFDASSKTCSVESCDDQSRQSSYISFNAQAPVTIAKKYDQNKLYYSSHNNIDGSIGNHHQQHDFPGHLISSSAILDVSADHHQAPSDAALSFSSYTYEDINEFLRHADWEDLRSVVDYAAAAATNNPASYYQTS